MQSREPRFVLCIQSGEREGERVPLDEGTLQVGRRPECGLVLKDGSVSGKHAEIRVAGEQIELVDLGSTNGTRVSGQKIERRLLGHGDALLFGNVRATLHDSRLAGEAAPIPSAPAELAVPAPDSGALGKVSADKLTRTVSASRRTTLWIVLFLLLVGGGGAAYLAILRFSPASGPVGVQEIGRAHV